MSLHIDSFLIPGRQFLPRPIMLPRRCGLAILVGLCLVIGLPWGQKTAGAEPDDERLARILADWDKRREQLQVVRYSVSGEETIPKGSTLDAQTHERTRLPQPDRDQKVKKRFLLLLDFAKNRHRLECDFEEFNRYVSPDRAIRREVQGSSFDGTSLLSFNDWDKSTLKPNPRKPAAGLAITKGYVGNYSGFDHYTYPLFLGHACFARDLAAGKGYLPGNLKAKPNPKRFAVRGSALFAKRPCIILRVPGKVGYTDIWVDSERDSAIVRIRGMMDGDQVTNDLRIDYQQTTKGWLPKHWTWEWFIHYLDGSLEHAEEMRVDKVDLEPHLPDGAFSFSEKPGMLILEDVQQVPAIPFGAARVTGEKWFRVGADGKRSEVSFPEDSPVRSWRWWRFAIGPLILATAWVFIRLIKKRGGSGKASRQGP